MNVPREMFPISSMLVSLYHTFPQSIILLGACLLTGWNPDLVGFGAGADGAGHRGHVQHGHGR